MLKENILKILERKKEGERLRERERGADKDKGMERDGGGVSVVRKSELKIETVKGSERKRK